MLHPRQCVKVHCEYYGKFSLTTVDYRPPQTQPPVGKVLRVLQQHPTPRWVRYIMCSFLFGPTVWGTGLYMVLVSNNKTLLSASKSTWLATHDLSEIIWKINRSVGMSHYTKKKKTQRKHLWLWSNPSGLTDVTQWLMFWYRVGVAKRTRDSTSLAKQSECHYCIRKLRWSQFQWSLRFRFNFSLLNWSHFGDC